MITVYRNSVHAVNFRERDTNLALYPMKIVATTFVTKLRAWLRFRNIPATLDVATILLPAKEIVFNVDDTIADPVVCAPTVSEPLLHDRNNSKRTKASEQ